MLVLTREIGQPVRLSDGTVLGRIIDLSARLSDPHPSIHRLGIGQHRRLSHLVPWAAVAAFESSSVLLRSAGTLDEFKVRGRSLDLEADELLLMRDVLDTQIVDVNRHRAGRVSDVLLTRGVDGSLNVAAVDIGLRQIYCRLGLSWLGNRLPDHAIDWQDLHLTSHRGHEIQLAVSASAVHRLDSHDLAELLTRLSVEKAAAVIDTVGPTRAAAAVSKTHPAVGNRLMRALDPADAVRLVKEMPAESIHHYAGLVRTRDPLVGRRFSRLHGWRLHRPPSGRDHRLDER